MITVDGLNFVNAFFTPHCNIKNEYTDRLGHMKESIKNNGIVGIGISNCCALEIIDDKFRLIREDASAYGIKTYWHDSDYIGKNGLLELCLATLDIITNFYIPAFHPRLHI